MAGEMISRADAGFANIWGLQDCVKLLWIRNRRNQNGISPAIHKGNTAAMDLTEPDAGSDLQAVQLKLPGMKNAMFGY